MTETRDRYATVTVTLTRRQAEALLSAVAQADVYYDSLVDAYGHLSRDEAVGRRVLGAGADRLRDALCGGGR